MSKVYKAIYLKHFRAALKDGRLQTPPGQTSKLTPGRLKPFHHKEWVVYAKAPFKGPEAVVEYLGRYTHKVAISNHRIVRITESHVYFRYKDYRLQGKRKTMQLKGMEFLRRFCLHILPSGFRRIRHYGILSNFHKARALEAARDSLHLPIDQRPPKRDRQTRKQETLHDWLGRNPNDCTHCGAKNTIVHLGLISYPNAQARAPPIPPLSPRQAC